MSFLNNRCKKLFLIILLFSFSSSLCQNIDDYKWKNRLIIIKATEETKEKLALQMKRFENSFEEFKERRFCVIEVLDKVYREINYLNGKHVSDWKRITTGHKIFSNKTTFKVLLIGLDGGVKRMYNQLVKLEDILKEVDNMPMRAREIKNKSHR